MALEPNEKHEVISNGGQNKLWIIPEAPTTGGKAELFMHSPALSPFHIWGKNLKLERQNSPIFKNILEHGIVDICFENCSRMSEAHFSIASNFKTHLVDYIGERGDNVPRLFSRLPDIETTMCLDRKRKRPDKHALCSQIRREQENVWGSGPAVLNCVFQEFAAAGWVAGCCSAAILFLRLALI
ncbi:hypothetical protein MTR_3g010890 [Medicago truncatula]|uniref:Uncharacterized protein n=1 Tax=Medicago truncatula TaxID=3880 RepID=G7IVI7_MEDTR|nr:hypothetical protein MTR_3g010890 [Medicago truncatula]